MMKTKISIQWMLLTVIVALFFSAILPSGVVNAATLEQDPPPSGSSESDYGKIAEKRVEIRYTRTQRFLEREQRELARALEALPKLEERINTLKEKGKDTAALETILPELTSGLEAVSASIDKASEIFEQGAGFDADGKVTDISAAREMLSEVNSELDDAHIGLKNLMYELRKAYRAFREANPFSL